MTQGFRRYADTPGRDPDISTGSRRLEYHDPLMYVRRVLGGVEVQEALPHAVFPSAPVDT